VRYGLAIGTGALTACVFTFFFPIEGLTPLMETVSQVSKFAVLLPVVAGFAGAINICQSQQDSLVSGAAVGILVAASLAPPVGLLGIGLMQWDIVLVKSSAFRILLQLVGIHTAATMVFHFYGKLSPKGVRFVDGSKTMRNVTAAISAIAFAALIYWQVESGANLEKASMEAELDDMVTQVFKSKDDVKLVSSSTAISEKKVEGKNLVLFELTVYDTDHQTTAEELKAEIQSQFDQRDFDLKPVYTISFAEK
ncbi:MAG TPA: DUF389 domain-containing protein, partial [Cryomorphaceae bacterium]|nr:DUF389 domain-containing protein [Cryomorphaceae bacterium]